MYRATITHSETGDYAGWFDVHKAVEFSEDTWFDGSNRISRATGSQWNHERLYYTAKGKWVLHYWSQWQGSRETYHELSETEAIAWLLAQSAYDSEQFDKLPETIQDSVLAALDDAEK